MNDPHVVYRCYDATDRLLYVGCTRDIVARMQVHAASWNNPASALLSMRMTRYEVEEFPTRAEAREAERRAIYNEEPLGNVHHQRERVTPQERYLRVEEYLEATRPPRDPELSAAIANALAGFASP
jgi:predicted GIY-YIG superfamily endonuclease